MPPTRTLKLGKTALTLSVNLRAVRTAEKSARKPFQDIVDQFLKDDDGALCSLLWGLSATDRARSAAEHKETAWEASQEFECPGSFLDEVPGEVALLQQLRREILDLLVESGHCVYREKKTTPPVTTTEQEQPASSTGGDT